MKKNPVHIILLFAAVLAIWFAAPAMAATCTAKATGYWGSSSTWSGCSVPGSNDTVIIPDPYTVVLSANTTVNAVTINNGGALYVGGYNFQVNGATSISGLLMLTATSGSKTFIGSVTVNSGGEWNNYANEAVTFRGGITNNGTFTAGTAVQTFNTNNQTIGGSSAISMPSVTVTGVTLTNTGVLSVSTALAGNGEIANGANATLNIGDPGSISISTLTASAAGNLVNYNYYGSQTIKSATYYHLTLSGSGTKSLAAATTINGNLAISSGTTLDVASNSNNVTLGGDFTNDGSFNPRAATVLLNGSAQQTVGGNSNTTFYNLTVNNTTSGGSGVVLDNDVTVSHNLALTKGIVATGTNTLALSYACSSSSPSGSSASFVAGLLKLTFPSGSISCTFPVGDTSTRRYAPITVSVVGSGGGTLTGSTNPDTGDVKQAAAGFDPNASVNRYWTLTKGSLSSFTSYSATLVFNNPADLDDGASPDNFYVRHYTNSSWMTPSVGTTTSTSTQATGITQTGFGDFVVGISAPSSCSPPAGAPSDITCQCDNFGRSDLNPSTIFENSNWLPNSSSGPAGFPQIAIPGYLRLTDNQGNESNSATVPGIFPAAGNYISIEFKHYAYNGSGADGIGVVLSDYSQPPTPGAFGGSLGYAQKTGISGFNYGWLGVALDEFGNYSNPTEGRIDGPGSYPESIGIRGSGSGTNGYPWIGGALCGASGFPKTGYPNTYVLPAPCADGTSGSLDNRTSKSPSRGYSYRIVVDARNYTDSNKSTLVSVLRDTAGGSSYSSLIAPFDIYAAKPTQAAVPANWQITFTGSTGGSTNIHEIAGLKVCASNMLAPTSSSTAGGFNAIDSVLGRDKVSALYGHIFMKIARVPFKLNIAALATPTTNGVNTLYASSSNKTVTVKLIDDSVGPSCNASTSACTACSKTVVATQTMTFKAADAGFKTSADFTVNNAYKRLIAQVSDGTTTGCSVDAFSVRPAYYTLSSVAAPTPAGPFRINVTELKDAYGNTISGSVGSPRLASSITNPAMTSWSTGASYGTFYFNDVGFFNLADNAIFDSQFGNASGEANDQTNGDCNAGTAAVPNACYGYSGATCNNAAPYSPDNTGKYGCDIGSKGLSNVGRFYPDHYEASVGMAPACAAGDFTYMGQQFSLTDSSGSAPVTIKALAYGKTFADAALPSYSGSYTPRASVWFGAQDGATPATDLISRLAPTLPAKGATASQAWTNGVYTAPASTFTFFRPASATPDATWGAYDSLNFGVTVSDADGAALKIPAGQSFTLNSTTYQAINGGTPAIMRLGRLRIDNAYGSELMALPVNVTATYWNGTLQRYATNTLDRCTTTAGLFLNNYSGMTTGSTGVTNTGVLTNGTGTVTLRRPVPRPTGNRGSVILNSNMNDYLPGSGQETFGVYRSSFIFLREMY